MKTLMTVIIVAAIVIALLTIAPVLTFWAINALFAYSIPLTWKTWLAFWVLAIMFGGAKVSVK